MTARLSTAVLLVLALFGWGCGSDTEVTTPPPTQVRVASFDFPESELLAELYSQALEHGGFEVKRVGVVGPREVVAPAIEVGLIDIVPEYLGTVQEHFASSGDVDITAQQSLAARGLTLLKPARAEDTNVFVVTSELAAQYDLKSISDLSRLPADQVFGGPVECPDRPLCLLGLESTYGLTFAEFVPLRSLAITAEALLQGEVDVALMFSTAAALTPDTLVVLIDDQNLQPAENVVPLVRVDALERWPGLAGTLNQVSDELTTAALQDLNRRVAQGQPPSRVAAEWIANTMFPPG